MMEMSGKRKYAAHKVPLHLWPVSATIYGCMALFAGKTKYGHLDWRNKKILASDLFGALQRHVNKYWEGEETDPDDGTPHLGNALCCLAIWIDAKCCGTLIDDRNYNGNGVVAAFKEFTHLMVQIEEQYKDRKPKSYTISDEPPTAD